MSSKRKFSNQNRQSTKPLIERLKCRDKQQTISVCMIVRDEEQFLPGCLSSIKDLADEIIVVDTGSVDRTLEIARSFGAKVYDYEWKDDFADARNKSIDYATSDWILILDADERLDPHSKSVIKRAVNEPNYDAYGMTQLSQVSDNEFSSYRAGTYRLWRNHPEFRYRGKVHECINESIANITSRTARIDAVIEHLGYLPEVFTEKQKTQRNRKLIQVELENDPDNLYFLYHLAKEYYASGEFKQALPCFEKALKLLKSPTEMFGIQIYSFLISMYCTSNRYDDAMELVSRVESYDIEFPEIIYSKGRIFLGKQKYAAALECFKKAKRMKENDGWLGDTSVSEYKADWGIAASYLSLGKFEEAIEAASVALEKKPDFANAHDVIVQAYKALEQWDRLEDHLLAMHRSNPQDAKVIQKLISIYEEQERVSDARAMYNNLLDCGLESPEIRFKLGIYAEAENDAEAAEQHYMRAIQLDNNTPEVYNNLGMLYVNNGRAIDGLGILLSAIEGFPDFVNAYFNAGDVLYKAGKYSEAADMYQGGLLRLPNYAPGYFMLGNCYYQMSAYAAAVMAYRQALAIQPDYPEVVHNLSLIEEKIAA